MPDENRAFEPHFEVKELAAMWRLGRESVRLLIKDEPGVIKMQMGRKKRNCRYSVPASVAERIHRRLETIGR